MATFFAVTTGGRSKLKGVRSLDSALVEGRKLAGFKGIDVVETARHTPEPPALPSLEDCLRAAGWVRREEANAG